jgi:hypothetical protein
MPRALTSPDFRLFLGKSGSGKSSLMRHQAAGARRLLIHDPNGEPAWASCGAVVYDRAELVARLRAGAGAVVWRGAQSARSDREAVDAFEWANRCALAAGDMLILWDEVDRFTTPGRLPPFAYEIVNAGRHRGLKVYAASRRVRRVSRDLSANAGRIMVARMTEPGDLAWIKATMGDAAARQAPTLPPFHFLDWTETACRTKKAPFR